MTTTLVVLAVVAVLALPVTRIVLRLCDRTTMARDLGALEWPVRACTAAIVARVAVGSGRLDEGSAWYLWLAPILLILAIAAGAWVVTRTIEVVKLAMFRRLSIDVANNQRVRSRRTQLDLIVRVADVFVWTTALIIALLTFRPIRDIGPSLVAYAGVIGVILGLALRAPLESLMSGIIVAVSEPIRIDDVVVAEGEWGKIEEINLTHVVVRIWDRRRLVLPTSYFVNEPFENWTKDGSQVIGSVTFRADFQIPVPAIRAEYDRVVADSPLWDGDVLVLQVTEMGERSIELRGLATARDAQDSWDLRCHIREALLDAFNNDPDNMPRLRAEPLVAEGAVAAASPNGDHRPRHAHRSGAQ